MPIDYANVQMQPLDNLPFMSSTALAQYWYQSHGPPDVGPAQASSHAHIPAASATLPVGTPSANFNSAASQPFHAPGWTPALPGPSVNTASSFPGTSISSDIAVPGHYYPAHPGTAGPVPSSEPGQTPAGSTHALPSGPNAPETTRFGAVVRAQIATERMQEASARRRVGAPRYACPVDGCGSTFTRNRNLESASSLPYSWRRG